MSDGRTQCEFFEKCRFERASRAGRCHDAAASSEAVARVTASSLHDAQGGEIMTEQMNFEMDRRDFLKGAAAAVAGAALLSGGLSLSELGASTAFAATGGPVAVGDMVTGQAYTISANLYVPHSEHKQIIHKTAYMTNPNNPLDGQGFPTSPMSDNATIVSNGDGTYTVTIPVRNELFSLLVLGEANGVEKISHTTTPGCYTSEPRIDSITVKIAQLTGDPVFTGNTEYAAYPIVAAYKHWKIWLTVDFSSIKEA